MNVLNTIKSIADLTKKINDIELKSKIIDLQNEVYQLIEENHRLKMESLNQSKIDEVEKNLITKGNYYYLKKNGELEGPYCTVCWDSDAKLIRLLISYYPQNVRTYSCTICKKR